MSKSLPPYLEELELELAALGPETMLSEELDGFVAGLLVCPELIKPGDWLPVVYDAGGADTSSFTDPAHANRIFALIMQHYNAVAAILTEQPERYQPLLPTMDGDVVWEVWIDGFAAAVEMAPEAWRPLVDASEKAAAAFGELVRLIELSAAGPDLTQANQETVAATAEADIARWIVALNKWRTTHDPSPRAIEWGPPPMLTPAKSTKIGRNEPCPCGSGKKYKRCCGMG